MRFIKVFGLGFAIVLTGWTGLSGQAAAEDAAAATWHFAGSAQLAGNTNFDNAKKILTLASSLEFQNLVLNRFSSWLGKSLFSATNDDPASPLRPLLDDLLSAESFWALGGASNGPLNFIVALRLDDQRAQAWQDALTKVMGKPGSVFALEDPSFPGRQWKLAGGQSLWMVRAKDWLVAGRGDNLGSLQAQYIREAITNGRPGPALNQSWLEADLDWPRLAHWLPNFPRILQLARTKISLTARNQSLFMSANVVYPKPISWKFDPWRVPTNIIHDPLISFTAGQDIAAYMDPGEPLSHLTDNPLAGQYYIWGLAEMALETYGTWPVADATNSLRRLATEAAAAFNPALKQIGGGEMRWQPEQQALLWANVSPMLFPTLQAAPATNDQYLLASLFPLIPRNKPIPGELLQQILGHTNLVYYDWEGTGQRLMQWQLQSGMLPLFTAKTNPPPPPPPAAATNNPPALPRTRSPLNIEENWLTGLTPMLLDRETITEITRTAPAELTIARKSPFALSSVELVLLSHWLSDTGSPGINPYLLPQPAKMTGPGINPTSP